MTTEQAALTNLAATPGKIIATDLAAIQKLAGGSAASSLSPQKAAEQHALRSRTRTSTSGEQDCG